MCLGLNQSVEGLKRKGWGPFCPLPLQHIKEFCLQTQDCNINPSLGLPSYRFSRPSSPSIMLVYSLKHIFLSNNFLLLHIFLYIDFLFVSVSLEKPNRITSELSILLLKSIYAKIQRVAFSVWQDYGWIAFSSLSIYVVSDSSWKSIYISFIFIIRNNELFQLKLRIKNLHYNFQINLLWQLLKFFYNCTHAGKCT